MMNGCRAVCFDMDGTLLDTKVDYGRMASLILERLAEAGVPQELLDGRKGYKFNVDRAFEWMMKNRSDSEIQEVSDSVAKAARVNTLPNLKIMFNDY